MEILADVGHGALWPGRGLAAWQLGVDVDVWLVWLAGSMAVFTGLQPVVYCGQCILVHACLSAIA